MIHLINTIALVSSISVLVHYFFGDKFSQFPYINTTFNYGKLNVSKINKSYQIQKSCFKIFYTFAFTYSTFVWILVIKIYLFDGTAPDLYIKLLDFFGGGSARPVLFNPSETFLSTTLFHLQISRRFYESNFKQIFSSKGKMTVSTVVLSSLCYFMFISTNVLNSVGFVSGEFAFCYESYLLQSNL